MKRVYAAFAFYRIFIQLKGPVRGLLRVSRENVMFRKWIASALLGMLSLLAILPTRADNLTICAVSGHNGAAEIVSFVGAEGNASGGDGFAAFCFASGDFIDGVILGVDVHPGGTSTVRILGYLNDVRPVLCTLSITDPLQVTSGAEVDNAKVSLVVQDGSGVVFSSLVGDNQYGWITRSK